VFALADVETRGWGDVGAVINVVAAVIAGGWTAGWDIVVIASVDVMGRVEGGEVCGACILEA
jgi:hypothetical protein